MRQFTALYWDRLWWTSLRHNPRWEQSTDAFQAEDLPERRRLASKIYEETALRLYEGRGTDGSILIALNLRLASEKTQSHGIKQKSF
jgi:hypothetical protein